MSSISEKLNKWAILSVQDPVFLESVKIAYVFDNGNQAILVTRDDDVYTIGTNNSGCSGIDTTTCNTVGGDKCYITPRKVNSLCKKQLVSIVSGINRHVLALTTSGKVYSWGYNGNSELGHGTNTPNPNPIPTIITKLDQYQVKQVACGYNHSMALTNDGKVFVWGYNGHGQVGDGSTTIRSTPYQVPLGDAKCETITCTYYSSYAVTDRGKVFSWGLNSYGELGIGSTTNKSTPEEVTKLQNQVITKIIGGYNHVLALTDDGKLYTWGYNNSGQLGIGNTNNSNVPVQVGNNLGRFIEIAATTFNSYTSAAKVANGKVYVWGVYHGKTLLSPVPTGFKQLDDVFASPRDPIAMWRNFVVDADTTDVFVAQKIGQSFNKKEGSDFTFLVGEKEEPIYVHIAILKMRSEYFSKQFSGNWKEATQKSKVIKEFEFKYYKAYLQYLYTNEIDVTPTDAVEVMRIAHMHCEDSLKERCESLIFHGITVDNALELISLARTYELKDLEEKCFKYALNHMTAVVKSKAYDSFDKELMAKLVRMAAEENIMKT